MSATKDAFKAGEPGQLEAWVGHVQSQVKSVRFGIVEIVIHDAQVVQIEKTKKIRLDKPAGR